MGAIGSFVKMFTTKKPDQVGPALEMANMQDKADKARSSYKKSFGKQKLAVQLMRANYKAHRANVNELYDNAPQLDLGDYQGQLDEIYGGTTSDVQKYMASSDEYATSLLKEYQGAGKNITSLGEQAFTESTASYKDYLDQYKEMERSGMPGESIYRDKIGAQTASNISQLKKLGVTGSSAYSSLLSDQQSQLQDLAIESANYKASRGRDLAEAYKTYGGLTSDAYGNRINTTTAATGMQAQGYGTAIQNTQNMGAMSMNLGQQQANIRQNQAGATQQEFMYNQYYPQGEERQWQQNLAMANNPLPYQYNMYSQQADQYWSELMGWEQSQQALRQQTLQQQQLYQQQQQQNMNDLTGSLTDVGGSLTGSSLIF